jgi:hypothetical protein
MRDYGKCVAHPIVVGGWGQQKGTDTAYVIFGTPPEEYEGLIH